MKRETLQDTNDRVSISYMDYGNDIICNKVISIIFITSVEWKMNLKSSSLSLSYVKIRSSSCI